MGKNWTYQDQMNFESDIKDAILAETAYCGSAPQYKDLGEEDFYDFCDSFFQRF